MKLLQVIGRVALGAFLLQSSVMVAEATTTQVAVNKQAAKADAIVVKRKTLSTVNDYMPVSSEPVVKGIPVTQTIQVTKATPLTKSVSPEAKVVSTTTSAVKPVKEVWTTQSVSVEKSGPPIRVFIKNTSSSTVIPTVSTQVAIYGGKNWSSFPAGKPMVITSKGGFVYVDGKKVDTFISIQPKNQNEASVVSVDGVKYRGSLLVTTRLNQGRLAVINQVPMEEYLYGVVPEEAVPSWPSAALEAQAVAARTYALYAMQNKASSYYDVESDTRSQVYRGMGSEYNSTTKAVQATSGMVMMYKGKAIDALFHSDGGGYTEDSANVWGSSVPYLRAVNDAWGLPNASTYTWTEQTTRTKMEAALRAAGKDVGTLKTIRLSALGKRPMNVSDRGVSGRIKSAIFVGSKKTITIEGSSLMQIFGLRSTLFDFYVGKQPPADVDKNKISGDYHSFGKGDQIVYIKGYGWGHGLGMSQWGAAAMAKQAGAGQPNYYKKILEHYYTGVDIQRLY